MKKEDLEIRFWSKVAKSDNCWIWKAGRNEQGYGIFARNGKNMAAHRYSYTLAHGEIPKGLFICHHCDTPPCVRPDHLFAGTNKENMIDAIQKRRLPTFRQKDCARGHTFTPESVIVYRGRKQCAICITINRRKRTMRARALKEASSDKYWPQKFAKIIYEQWQECCKKSKRGPDLLLQNSIACALKRTYKKGLRDSI